VIETTIDERLVAMQTIGNPGQRNALGNAGRHERAYAIQRATAIDKLRVVILIDAER
jgi:enoyl-CoA hydratase/carnithine racemase